MAEPGLPPTEDHRMLARLDERTEHMQRDIQGLKDDHASLRGQLTDLGAKVAELLGIVQRAEKGKSDPPPAPLLKLALWIIGGAIIVIGVLVGVPWKELM